MTNKFLREMQLKKLGYSSGEPAEQTTEKPEKKKGINKQSDKRKEDKKEYIKIVKKMLAINPNCEIKEEGCQVKASGLHHQKKRTPATYLDERFLIRACDNCQTWVELHPLEAIQKGHSISKFSPTPDTNLKVGVPE